MVDDIDKQDGGKSAAGSARKTTLTSVTDSSIDEGPNVQRKDDDQRKTSHTTFQQSYSSQN